VFSLLITYWIFGLILFNRNIFIKIFVFAYALILFAAIDFFVLRILGISTGLVNDVNIKIGSILEMVIISFAVLYRMRELKLENEQMYLEIVNYSKLNSITNKSNVIDNLSLREHDIFNLIIEGNSNKEIANQLNISINTVKFHIKNIYDKLDVSSRKEVFKINKTSI
jgi:DNA-binding CsgD family transcriptional regulator